MKKIKFVLGIHNHQPVGNFKWVFEKGYDIAYKPFLEVMLKHKNIKWNLHSSGMLWEFMLEEHPEYILESSVPDRIEGIVTDSSTRSGYFIMKADSSDELLKYLPTEVR